ncbi:glycosyltransferase family 2 protein [Brevundimonas sp. Leaf363]|uniref:glycosyltransferase family 2 protein n=1 Tax=Brevundimonas sp. Leaf363 TaxID=1736353 RepID=UPI00138F9606|nr:glycosyltransferase family 2 protein [Brevundimonas sp. Leaf363]
MSAASPPPKKPRAGWRARMAALAGVRAPVPIGVAVSGVVSGRIAFPTADVLAEGDGWSFAVEGPEALRVRAAEGPVVSGRLRLDLRSPGHLRFGCQLVIAVGTESVALRLSEPMAQAFVDAPEPAALRITLRLVGRGRIGPGDLELALVSVEEDPAQALAFVDARLAAGDAAGAMATLDAAVRSGARSAEVAKRAEAVGRAAGPGPGLIDLWDALIGEDGPAAWRARRDLARVELDEAGAANGRPVGEPADVRMALAHHALGLGVQARAALEGSGDDGAARWALAGLDRFEGRPDRALERLEALAAGGAWAPGLAAMQAELLAEAGRTGQAQAVLDAASPGDRIDLARANLARGADRLEALNKVFMRHGLAPVTPTTPAMLDALTTQAAARSITGPRVSVMVPVFNAEATLATSLASVAAQTWAELEVLIVDDASTDGTARVAQAFARQDRRFRLLRNDRNRGPYHSRNRALAEAKGVFVTCQDADDWSHPERIERQVRALEAYPDWIAALARCATCTPDLVFAPRSRVPSPLRWSLPSLMVRRREAMAGVGYWDEVRFGADSEYLARLAARFGPYAVGRMTDGPLMLMRQSPDSLTASAGGGLEGVGHTLRIDYRQRYQAAHAGGALKRDRGSPRPFPVPPHLTERSEPRAVFERLLAGDLREPATVARARVLDGDDVGLVHTPLWSDRPNRPLAAEVRGLKADLVTAERTAQAARLTLLDARAFETPLSGLPALSVGVVEAVDDPAVDREAVEATARALFGAPVVWISQPASRG